VVHHDDKVWFDEATKLKQICDEVSARAAGRENVLLLSHFEATVSRLASLLRQSGQKYEQFSSLNPSELCSGVEGKIWLGAAEAFQLGSRTAQEGNGSLKIIVAEHYPIRSRDQVVVEAAGNLTCETELCFHFSLDDPVMKHFGAETVKALFERLSVRKDECISHRLVTTAIRNAQEKIESQVGKDVPTHSAEDWLKYNLPS
jgi:preprotein translocase subunit SecA